MKTLIIMPISRGEHLTKVFNRLELLKCDRNHTSLLVSVHGDKELLKQVQILVDGSNFADKGIVEYKTKRKARTGSPAHRRKDIANIHNEIRQTIRLTSPLHGGYDYIFGLEDDTIIADNTLLKLMALASQKASAGIVSGIEVGRWGIPYIGAWKADSVYDTSLLTTVQPYQQSGIEEVDATGLFCFLTKAEYYLNHEFKPYLDILGPDVDFGLALRQQGLQNYIDWSISCGHIDKNGNTLYANKDIRGVKYTKGRKAWLYQSYS